MMVYLGELNSKAGICSKLSWDRCRAKRQYRKSYVSNWDSNQIKLR